MSISRSNFEFEVKFGVICDSEAMSCKIEISCKNFWNTSLFQKTATTIVRKLGVSERWLLCVTTDVYLNLG